MTGSDIEGLIARLRDFHGHVGRQAAESLSSLRTEQEELARALCWAMDEIDALSNKLCQFAYPQGMAMVGREDQTESYKAAVAARSVLTAREGKR